MVDRVARHPRGISDAFRDAELCASALDEALSGNRDHKEAMGDYWAARDARSLPVYDLTAMVAELRTPGNALVAAVQDSSDAQDAFTRAAAGVIAPPSSRTSSGGSKNRSARRHGRTPRHQPTSL
ncbi:hypothetical protein [Actinoplanes sp. NBRC 103695]|uniref:hypothetical protein n=1 Tax=Actinoplanes sp. NBRC 103695 TaxID=3032202 RepID=UPI0024A0B8DE|nr:hypothetical protein [Actinoplanes sp. NBRC 103695]GLY94921.1 hypothetical protein Acsp02_21760 [Actinoplanes sp. NBRC 103695]